jgi:DegV family protein with EDD domain
MHAIKVLTDSTSDLPVELVKKYDIGVIPLYVNFGTQSFRDNRDITPTLLYKRVKEKGTLPTTSAPTPANYATEFEKYINNNQDVIYIGISSKLSSSYQNACTAADKFPQDRIRVIDSQNLSSGIGLLVMTAADCIEEGKDLKATAAAVEAKIGKVETEFILDSVEYLHKGGRCTGLQMFFSSLLSIHPVIQVENGSMRLAAKVRGGRQQVLNHLLNNSVKAIDNIDPKRVFVTHSEAEDDAKWLKNKLSELPELKEVIISEAGCVISTHCGPRTVGILYLRK